MTDRLARIISRVQDLPTLPRTVLRITELVNNPKSSAKEIAQVITDDQVLTLRLLRLVNSSFYGFPQRISTVTGAIVLLGFDAIRHLLLTSSVFDVLSGPTRAVFQKEALWDHSLACAVGAKVIGTTLGHEKIEELFVAGLLHDIGKIVEMIYLPREFAEAVALVEKERLLLREAEERVMGFTHAEFGAALGAKWNLPAKIITVIAHHHSPQVSSEYGREAAAVHLADILCRALEMGSGGDPRIPPLLPDAWEALGLDADALEPVMEEMEREFFDIGAVIGRRGMHQR